MVNIYNFIGPEAIAFDCHDSDVLSIHISCLAYRTWVRLRVKIFYEIGVTRTRAYHACMAVTSIVGRFGPRVGVFYR